MFPNFDFKMAFGLSVIDDITTSTLKLMYNS